MKIHSENSIFEGVERKGEGCLLFLNSNFEVEIVSLRKEKTSSNVIFRHPMMKRLTPFFVKMVIRDEKLVMFFVEFVLWINFSKVDFATEDSYLEVNSGKMSDQSKKKLKEIFGHSVIFYKDFIVKKVDPFC